MSFYRQIAPYYHHIFKINQAQVNYITETISDKNALIVDMGCGIGTLSLELANYYNQVRGVDVDTSMIAAAKRKVGMRDGVEFVQGSMLDLIKIFKPNSVDGLVCFGNTLVHLNSMNEVHQFFMQAKTVLKPDGKLLVQLVNYDRILTKNITSLPLIENEEIIFERYYKFNESSEKIDFNTKLTVKEGGEILKNTVKLLPVLQHNIATLLTTSGFKNTHFYGNFTNEDFNPESSPALVFVAW
ncbi:MAG: class I SAM-dependent methyltransferase [Bacteroidetes bacterium]|jgi:SAM-dependent methyltransferase|nr:class I SAM-dependent methyltransferase [Bacteroidota bacterium]